MKLPGKRAKEAPRAGAAPAQAQSEETLRVRARRRLIGAVALVLGAVVVFPLIFETQPKPVASNLELTIPPQARASAVAPASLGAAQPGVGAASAAAPAAAATGVSASTRPASAASGAAKPPRAAASAPTRTPAPAAQTAAPHVAPRPAARADTETAAKPDVAGARQALAALEGKNPAEIPRAQAEAAASGDAPNARYVVQAGAYADTHAAHQARLKIEHAGLHSYAQVVDTHAGKRVRVRVGPFASRDQADRAAARIRALGLSAAVLTL